MLKFSHVILLAALVAFAANTVRMNAQINTHRAHSKYLMQCWDAENQQNLSTDTCVESPFWAE